MNNAVQQSAKQPYCSKPSETARAETAARRHHRSLSPQERTTPAIHFDKPPPSQYSPLGRSSDRRPAGHTLSPPVPSANRTPAIHVPRSSPPLQMAAPSCTARYPDSSGGSTPPLHPAESVPPPHTETPAPLQSAGTTHESKPHPRPPNLASGSDNPPPPPAEAQQIANSARPTAPTAPQPTHRPSRNLFATRGCRACRSSSVKKSIVLKSRSIAGSLQIFAPIVR